MSWGIEQHGSAMPLLQQQEGADFAQSRLFSDEGTDMQALLKNAAADVSSWITGGIQLLSVLDPEYPANLGAVHDRPPLIFVSGKLEASDARSVAVIGSRAASRRGVAEARAVAEHLVSRGYTVVSGLAAGVDAAAHRAALDAGGRTVAVLATTLGRTRWPSQVRVASRSSATS